MKPPKSVILAIIGIVAATVFMIQSQKPRPQSQPVRTPSQTPYADSIAATGVIESFRENVAVAPYRAGKVIRVWAREGRQVSQGAPLYQLEQAEILAEIDRLRAVAASQQATLERLRQEPRNVEIPPLAAAVEQAQANYRQAQTELARFESLAPSETVSQLELSQRRNAAETARAQLDRARAELTRLKAGTWTFDIRKAQADLAAIQAQIRQQQVLLRQSTIYAPQTGEVLKVNIRPGEYISLSQTEPPVVLGDTHNLQIRVDIDEVNASRVQPGMNAVAFIKGDSTKKIPVQFVRVVPYMVPKRNLSGSSTERVDVRVLQLIYSFIPPEFPVYVGQQVDVYLKSNRPSSIRYETR